MPERLRDVDDLVRDGCRAFELSELDQAHDQSAAQADRRVEGPVHARSDEVANEKCQRFAEHGRRAPKVAETPTDLPHVETGS